MDEFDLTDVDFASQSQEADVDESQSDDTKQQEDAGKQDPEATQEQQKSSHEEQETDEQDEESDGEDDGFVVRVGNTIKSLPPVQAREYASKGVSYVENVLPKLQTLAGAMGKKTDELLDALIEERIDSYRSKISETVLDPDMVDKLVEMERSKWGAAAPASKEPTDWDSKMARDFLELQKEYPDIKDFSAVNPKVIRMAANKGISLLSAQLLHDRSQAKKADAQKANAANAAAASVPKQEGGTDDAENFSDFVKALWS